MINLVITSKNKRKKYSLTNGLKWLEVHEGVLQKENAKEILTIEISHSKDPEFGFKGELELGGGNGFELFSWLEETLLEKYPGNEESIGDFITILLRERTIQEKNIASKQFIRKPRKKLILFLAGGVVSFFVVVGLFFFFSLYQTESKPLKQTDFSEDLQVLSPEELGDKYPKKLIEIEDYYVQESDFKSLEKFNKKYPTKNGQFDLAFYQKKWEIVVKSDVDSLSEDRKIMLAHSFIQLNQLGEAEILNKQLKSKTLSTEIDYAYIQRGLGLLHKQQLEEAKKLLTTIQTEEAKTAYHVYLDDADLIIQMIQLYEGKKDEANKELWIRKLNRIGELEENGL